MEPNLDNVLYIDDERNNLLLFQAMFSKYYNIYIAISTVEAENIMSQVNFKVIISDINMPQENGLHFFSRLPKTENSPILVILTAYVSDTFLLEAINQGRIFRYITKPFVRDQVKEVIDQAIHIYDLRFENHQLYLQILESQRNFYKIFQSSQDGIAILDENEIFLEANIAFYKVIKTSVQNINGCKLHDLIPKEIHNLIVDRFSQLFETTAARNELEYFSKIDGKKNYEINSAVIDYKGIKAVLLIVRDITERRISELKLLNAVVEAEERERSRIAKDLHDGLGPILSSLKMYMEWLNKQERINDHPDIVNLSLKSINEAIVSLKRISNNLSPHILEKFGLVAALNKYIESIKKVSNIQFNIVVNLNNRFELTTEMSLYRIITECITNTIRHAQASFVDIILKHNMHTLYLTYKDNGIGFSFSEEEKYYNGQGLHNINNRIKTLGGKITIHTKPGAGFTIESEIPIN